jgi:calcium-dependent protein kinase
VDAWNTNFFFILCGLPPIFGDNDEKIVHVILRGDIDFNREPCPKSLPTVKISSGRCLPSTPRTTVAD